MNTSKCCGKALSVVFIIMHEYFYEASACHNLFKCLCRSIRINQGGSTVSKKVIFSMLVIVALLLVACAPAAAPAAAPAEGEAAAAPAAGAVTELNILWAQWDPAD